MLVADPSTDYHLTFDDEFSAFRHDRWQTSDFWGMRNNPGDYQAQWFADPEREEKGKDYTPFQINKDRLVISAVPTPSKIYAGPTDLPYLSGQITTAQRFTQRYGYFELRAKLPAGKGLWSRFWLLTDDGVWPGEYDIFEVLGREAGQVHQNTHFKGANDTHLSEGATFTAINPVDGQFHTYGFLWEETSVRWFVDGIETLHQSNRIDIPMYVLIDLAIGKDPSNLWPGDPDAATHWPATLELDHFRVYSNDPSLPSVIPDSGYSPSLLPSGYKVVDRPRAGPLPPDWRALSIGSPKLKGSCTWNPITGEWIIKGAGGARLGQFAGTHLKGDGVLMATVQSLTRINTNDDRAGVTMRASVEASGASISLDFVTSFNSPDTRTRVVLTSQSAGAAVELGSHEVETCPITLRLSRQGETFIASYRSDSSADWIEVGRCRDGTMAGTVLAGLVVGGNSANATRLSRGIFKDVALSPAKSKTVGIDFAKP